jgi:glutathione S-transferase
MTEFRNRAEGAWGVLNAQLAGRSYVALDRLTIADLSICGYLYFDDEIGVDWSAYPNVQSWLARLRAQPRWKHPYELLPGHPLPSA